MLGVLAPKPPTVLLFMAELIGGGSVTLVVEHASGANSV
jgi:hypothetical protein